MYLLLNRKFSSIMDVQKGELSYTAGTDVKTARILDISLDVSQKLQIDLPLIRLHHFQASIQRP